MNRFSLLIALLLSVTFHPGMADVGGSSSTSYVAQALPTEIAAMVEGEQFENAISALNDFIDVESKNADAWNYLGYSLRKVGLYQDSLKAYKKALKLDKKHLGAHEYIGELYLTLGQPQQAEKHLKKLAKYCGDCEQYQKLAAAIQSNQ